MTTNSGTISLLNGRGFNASGAFTNSGIVGTGPGVFAGGNFTITNQSGGLFDVGNDAGLTGFSTFTNAGTLRKSGGAGTLTLNTLFVNQGGTLDAEGGTLSMQDGSGNGDVWTGGGTFIAAAGATLQLTPAGRPSTSPRDSFSGPAVASVVVSPPPSPTRAF